MEKAHILLVDDCEITLQITSLTLQSAGYEVSTLSNPHQMVSAIREKSPDLILLDIHMPGLRGDRVVPILKGHRFSRDLPIFLFSDSHPAELERRASASGADGFLCKTDDPVRLAKELQGALTRYRNQLPSAVSP